MPTFYYFATTGADGSRLYGSCLSFVEELPPTLSKEVHKREQERLAKIKATHQDGVAQASVARRMSHSTQHAPNRELSVLAAAAQASRPARSRENSVSRSRREYSINRREDSLTRRENSLTRRENSLTRRENSTSRNSAPQGPPPASGSGGASGGGPPPAPADPDVEMHFFGSPVNDQYDPPSRSDNGAQISLPLSSFMAGAGVSPSGAGRGGPSFPAAAAPTASASAGAARTTLLPSAVGGSTPSGTAHTMGQPPGPRRSISLSKPPPPTSLSAQVEKSNAEKAADKAGPPKTYWNKVSAAAASLACPSPSPAPAHTCVCVLVCR
jgi:hypothetical protein